MRIIAANHDKPRAPWDVAVGRRCPSSGPGVVGPDPTGPRFDFESGFARLQRTFEIFLCTASTELYILHIGIV